MFSKRKIGYASLVRAFSFNEEEIPWASFPPCWAESLNLRPFLGLRKELLPVLKSLEWKAVSSRGIIVGLPHFVTSNLNSLSVTFLEDDATKALPSLAEFLESSPPPLRNLELIFRFEASSKSRTFFDTAHGVEHIIHIFPHISRLRIDTRMLVCGVKSPAVFQNLREIALDYYVNCKDTPGYDHGLLRSTNAISLPRLELIRSQELSWGCFGSLFQHSWDTVVGFTYSQPEKVELLWCYENSRLIRTFKAMAERFVNLTTLALQGISIPDKDADADLTGSLLPFL
jgi:hypothetical protein